MRSGEADYYGVLTEPLWYDLSYLERLSLR